MAHPSFTDNADFGSRTRQIYQNTLALEPSRFDAKAALAYLKGLRRENSFHQRLQECFPEPLRMPPDMPEPEAKKLRKQQRNHLKACAAELGLSAFLPGNSRLFTWLEQDKDLQVEQGTYASTAVTHGVATVLGSNPTRDNMYLFCAILGYGRRQVEQFFHKTAFTLPLKRKVWKELVYFYCLDNLPDWQAEAERLLAATSAGGEDTREIRERLLAADPKDGHSYEPWQRLRQLFPQCRQVTEGGLRRQMALDWAFRSARQWYLDAQALMAEIEQRGSERDESAEPILYTEDIDDDLRGIGREELKAYILNNWSTFRKENANITAREYVQSLYDVCRIVLVRLLPADGSAPVRPQDIQPKEFFRIALRLEDPTRKSGEKSSGIEGLEVVFVNFPCPRYLTRILEEDAGSDDQIRKMLIFLQFYCFYLTKQEQSLRQNPGLSLSVRDFSVCFDEFCLQVDTLLRRTGFVGLYPPNAYDCLFLLSARARQPLQALQAYLQPNFAR